MFSLSILDCAALGIFISCRMGYSYLVVHVDRFHRRSVIAAMDEHRFRWMRAMLLRDNRIGDVNIIGNLMNSTSFPARMNFLKSSH